MKRFMENKKGSYVVFLTITLCAVMILVCAVIRASGQAAIGSTVRSFGVLWGRSVLAEYDRTLKARYGLFGFYGDASMVEKKLDFYAAYTCSGKNYLDYRAAKASLDEYPLTDVEIFERQVQEIVLAGIRPEPIDRAAGEEEKPGNRAVRSGWILSSLPSAGKKEGLNLTQLLQKLRSEFSLDQTAARAADIRYIFTFFKHAGSDEDAEKALGETFLQNEAEYIISGKADDARARKYVRRILTAVRNGLNLTYLYSCTEKREAALAAAEVLSPGPAAVLTQALILESWAFLEAQNDLRMLDAGEGVAIRKKDENWAISLENVLSAEFGSDTEDSADGDPAAERREPFIRPQNPEGQDYEDYLKLLTAALPQEIRVLRMMDLIQINLKYLYTGSFLLRDYYTGLDYELHVNGKTYGFTEAYDRKNKTDPKTETTEETEDPEETGKLSG